MEEQISEAYSDKGASSFDQRLCQQQQQNSFVVPQMKLVQNNTSNNPTLLVSEILEQNTMEQENMGLNHGCQNMNKNQITSSLLPPPINHNRPWRSNSLTPPTPRQSEDCQVSQCDMMSNFGVWNGTGGYSNYKLRSHSLTVLKNGQIRDEAHEVTQPVCSNCGLQPYATSSSNDDQIDELIRNLPYGSGMRGLKIYLKKLRLHKYCATFLKYTYDEFINLDDETLKRDGVTLGARGKIMKSLEKIHRRPERLLELLKIIEDIDKEPDMIIKLLNILNELEEIVLMPLKPPGHKTSTGRSDGDEKTNSYLNIPQMIYKLLEKIFIFTMLGHASDEVNQILYGLLHNALKQECFNETQKLSMRSWIDKLGKVYENVTQPKSYDKRRSFRGEGGNAGRRVSVRSGSISSNNHGLHHAHDSFCQKRHSYAFQDDKMQVPPTAALLHPSRHSSQDAYIPSINRARSSSGLYQASNNLIGTIGDCTNRRESAMSNDSGCVFESRRTSEADYFSSLSGIGCNPSLLIPSSLDWGQQQPLITLQNYTNRKIHDQATGGVQAENSSSSICDFLSMQEPIARRDSGMSTNSESSRRSSYFSASPVPPSLVFGSSNSQKNNVAVPNTSSINNQIALGVCSASSGCSQSSTDSLEQDLQNLAVSVSQKGLE